VNWSPHQQSHPLALRFTRYCDRSNACYHLPHWAWDHGAFAFELPHFLHLTNISAPFNRYYDDVATAAEPL
jgi:hypothetical protein